MADTTNGRLRAWNIGVGLLHLAQAIAILVLSNDFSIPVQSKVATGPPGEPLEVERVLAPFNCAGDGSAASYGVLYGPGITVQLPMVDDLRDDAARLEKRIERLLSRQRPS